MDVEYLNYLFEEQIHELIKFKKIDWLKQDIEKLIENTFCPHQLNTDIQEQLPLTQENQILLNFNKIVQDNKRKYQSTLFFSKKAQKDFLNYPFEGIKSSM